MKIGISQLLKSKKLFILIFLVVIIAAAVIVAMEFSIFAEPSNEQTQTDEYEVLVKIEIESEAKGYQLTNLKTDIDILNWYPDKGYLIGIVPNYDLKRIIHF